MIVDNNYGKLRYEFKKILSSLEKYFTIVLIFRSNPRKNSKLIHYFLKNGYDFHAVY